MIADFKTKKIKAQKLVSKILRQNREKKKFSLNKVEKATKIKKEYLKALERGKYQLLPEKVYVRGFLRTLANFYSIDPVKLIDSYRQETDPKQPKEVGRVGFDVKKISQPIIVVTPRLLMISFGVLAGLLIVGYLWYEVSGFAIAPRLVVNKPEEEQLIIKKDQIIIKGETDQTASLTINQEAVPVNQKGKFNQKIRLQAGYNLLNIKATNRSGREAVKQVKVIVNRKYVKAN